MGDQSLHVRYASHGTLPAQLVMHAYTAHPFKVKPINDNASSLPMI
jgi:hypothetical protein